MVRLQMNTIQSQSYISLGASINHKGKELSLIVRGKNLQSLYKTIKQKRKHIFIDIIKHKYDKQNR